MMSFIGRKVAVGFRHRWAWFSGVLIFSLILGCATTPYEDRPLPEPVIQSYLHDVPPALHPYYRRVLREGRRNLVLNHERMGLAAMELGEYEWAERSFDIALNHIEAVYADDPNAARARSLWYAEGRKDFKGEPYERAMAYYYRGLLYLRRGDFENARACFKSGLLQDALAEEKRYRADFALLAFLEGWASHMLGDHDLAEASFREVKDLRPDFVPPAPEDNVLVIVETGFAPRKIASGKGGSELRFVPGFGFREKKVRLELGGSVFHGHGVEDIYWQASTRGGREVDKILAGKVHFKETNQQMGRTLTELSLRTLSRASRFGNDAGVVAIAAGILGLVGLGQQALASNTETRADTRYWDNLPDRVHVFTFNSEEVREPFVRVSFLGENDRELPKLGKRANIYFVNDRFGFAWVRSRSALGN